MSMKYDFMQVLASDLNSGEISLADFKKYKREVPILVKGLKTHSADKVRKINLHRTISAINFSIKSYGTVDDYLKIINLMLVSCNRKQFSASELMSEIEKQEKPMAQNVATLIRISGLNRKEIGCFVPVLRSDELYFMVKKIYGAEKITLYKMAYILPKYRKLALNILNLKPEDLTIIPATDNDSRLETAHEKALKHTVGYKVAKNVPVKKLRKQYAMELLLYLNQKKYPKKPIYQYKKLEKPIISYASCKIYQTDKRNQNKNFKCLGVTAQFGAFMELCESLYGSRDIKLLINDFKTDKKSEKTKHNKGDC